jgi:WD40 repeat protein/predicted phosphodiesterase
MSGKLSNDGRPLGLELRHKLCGHEGVITRIAWSPDGQTLASGSYDNTVRLWSTDTGELLQTIEGHSAWVWSIAWSSDGCRLASSSEDWTILLWDTKTWRLLRELRSHSGPVYSVAWSPDRHLLASGSYDHTIQLWNAETGERLHTFEGHFEGVNSISWSPDGLLLASGSYDKTIRIWNAETRECLRTLEGHLAGVNSVAWSVDGQLLASGAGDNTIRLWDQEGRNINILEGHTSSINSISFSADRRLLASKSSDSTILFWSCDNWDMTTLNESSSDEWLPGLSFHPKAPVIATLGERDTVIRIWDMEMDILLDSLSVTIEHTSAKVVLVGESNVGKSCLALRLVEDRYEEQGTTHGMRFWYMTPDQLDPADTTPAGEKRDVVLWDMGGQHEYRLINQLFLDDTALALVLLNPTRGQAAFNEVEEWNERLEKQLSLLAKRTGGRRPIKLLVGTKLDEESKIVDRASLDSLVRRCEFAGYYPTSAKMDRGILELRMAMSKALAWEALAKISRTEIFQSIRDEVMKRRERGQVIFLYADLKDCVYRADPERFDPEAVNTVVKQLAMQGIIVDTKLASGKRALLLQITEVERYAGSIIIAARDNPHGVPAIEERMVLSVVMDFPGIEKDERLVREQERVVLKCVVQLLLEHGICLRHEGLLIFPSLFRPTENGRAKPIPHSISLYYDFSGAIDNIYSSLVAWLAIVKQFGNARLWEGRAEFDEIGYGACGLRKVERGGGFARLDVYFDEETSQDRRDLFISFIDDHLHQYGVKIYECIEITCVCSKFRFSEEVIRERIANGANDVICPICEHRTEISEGALKARKRDIEMEEKLWALKTEIERMKERHMERAKEISVLPDMADHATKPLWILHLSDLHMKPDDDVVSIVQPLIADLTDRTGGLGLDQLDYLVISGDITNSGRPEEFENARVLVSTLINRFQLTSQRCIVVPGNHDLDWEKQVYITKVRDLVDLSSLQKGTYLEQSEVVLIRDEEHYPTRFSNFSEYFYHTLIQQEYPLTFEKQCIPFFFAEDAIQFLAINSCWEIDAFFQTRSSIHKNALSYGLTEADKQIQQVKFDKSRVLRIAVWHHPVTGNDKIVDDAFLELLQQARVRLCMHGHVHEEKAEVIGYFQKRRIYIVGAGTLDELAGERPESMPRLYNVLEVARDHNTIRVHTRCRRRAAGAWEGWGFWPAEKASEKRTYYKIEF